jgi:hypothetical protein
MQITCWTGWQFDSGLGEVDPNGYLLNDWTYLNMFILILSVDSWIAWIWCFSFAVWNWSSSFWWVVWAQCTALYILPTWCAQMPFKHVHIFGLGHATARNLGTDSFLCRWFLWVAACWTWCARLGATCIDLESAWQSSLQAHGTCKVR